MGTHGTTLRTSKSWRHRAKLACAAAATVFQPSTAQLQILHILQPWRTAQRDATRIGIHRSARPNVPLRRGGLEALTQTSDKALRDRQAFAVPQVTQDGCSQVSRNQFSILRRLIFCTP